MRSLTSTSFWIDTAERSVRAGAQGVLTASGLGAANSVHPGIALSVPWHVALVAGAGMAVASVLTSLASVPIPGADPETGSFLAAPPAQARRLRVWWSVKRSR